MSEEAAKKMAEMMGPNMMGPVAGTAVLAATGYAAGRGLLGGLFRNPWVMLAAGVAAGYYIHKNQERITLALSKASGMGKDFLLQQKESLADLVEEAKEKEAQQTAGGQPE
jgi:hypothetical protein